MGLDSCVKGYLRQHLQNSLSYHKTPAAVYAAYNFCACVVDLNVELHRKPGHVTTGEEWVTYLYNVRVRGTPGHTLVLVIDNPSRVPEVKDLCHLARAGAKRKRGNFIPLPENTVINDGLLPDWTSLTGSKHLLPRVWDYLLRGLKARIVNDAGFEKTVYFDTCYSSKIDSPYVSGKILKVCSHGGVREDNSPPDHRYGEGDLKTRAWVVHCLRGRTTLDEGVLVLSVDLDNIPIFAHEKFDKVCLMSNTVGRDANGVVVPKAKSCETVYEIINLGRIASLLKSHTEAFRVLLCLTKNDFNVNVHSLTTDRCLKTFFAMICMGTKKLDANKLLADPKYYLSFVRMCTSKVYGNRAMKIPRVPNTKINAFLSRAQWCLEYWSGKQQKNGGPDCRASGGWEVPTKKMDLKEYSGKVRLVPA